MEQIKRPFMYKSRIIRKRFLQFCRIHKLSPEEMLYGCCEGKISNFPYWYVDYLNKTKMEIRNRMKTGVINKLEMKDIWS